MAEIHVNLIDPITDEKHCGKIGHLQLYDPYNNFLSDEYDFREYAKLDTDGHYKMYYYRLCLVSFGNTSQEILFTEEKQNGTSKEFYIGKNLVATINTYNVSTFRYFEVSCPHRILS